MPVREHRLPPDALNAFCQGTRLRASRFALMRTAAAILSGMEMETEREMIVCIPGPWRTSQELAAALVEAHGPRYLKAGLILLDTVTSDSLEVDWEPHDP